MAVEGFYVHLADAMAINKARRPYYSGRTGGRSWWLSTSLIWFERSTLPLAWWLDRRALPFQARGIPIVEADFVSMKGVKPEEAPPPEHVRAVAPASAFEELAARLASVRRDAKPLIARSDFRGTADLTHAALGEVLAVEAETRASFIMTRHFMESFVTAAAHAVDYSARSGGETDALARSLVGSHVLGLRFTLYFDRRMQPFLSEGVGIILNDIPEIPAAEAYAIMKGGAGGAKGAPPADTRVTSQATAKGAGAEVARSAM